MCDHHIASRYVWLCLIISCCQHERRMNEWTYNEETINEKNSYLAITWRNQNGGTFYTLSLQSSFGIFPRPAFYKIHVDRNILLSGWPLTKTRYSWYFIWIYKKYVYWSLISVKYNICLMYPISILFNVFHFHAYC